MYKLNFTSDLRNNNKKIDTHIKRKSINIQETNFKQFYF